MGNVSCQISMSLDGYVAGPEQSRQDPLGRDGLRLHEWFFGLSDLPEGDPRGVDVAVVEEMTRTSGRT